MQSVNRDGFIVHLAIIWKIKNGRGISPQPLRIYRQHRTKPACRLCAASADDFSVISHRNSLQYASIPASFLCNLTKKLLAHLGICTDTIRNWLKASGIQPKETERQNRLERRQRDLEAEIRSLRKQLAQKDEAIEILKKSVGILSRP